jgi:glycosyltransferase involved in cell wall biosynthesis
MPFGVVWPQMLKRLRPFIDALWDLPNLRNDVSRLQTELDAARSRNDVALEIMDSFEAARNTPDYTRVFEAKRPLVTVCVGTYNRKQLLLERCLQSLLDQTYDNLEIIVVGDCCTDDTDTAVAALRDPRIRFENLTVRGPYPDNPRQRWMVAGTMPVNRALALASGDFVTHLDDDDEHAPHRIEKLLDFIRESRADLVYHPFHFETAPGTWRLNPARHFGYGQVTTSSIFYHSWLRRVPWNVEAYRYGEPGDWNRLRKILYLGAAVARYPEPLLRHFVERSQATNQ